MLNFFRRFRKKLADDGKPLKYLKYAIGEVLLVVIGILIALQINNWNYKRLERKEEIQILNSVKNDIENTIAEFDHLNQIRAQMLSSTKSIFKLTNSMDFENRELDSLIGLTFYRPTFNNILGTIDQLFSSGKISLIRNDSIRNFLISWPGSINDMIEEETYAMTLFQNHYYPVMAKYILIQDVIDQNFSTSFFGTQIRQEEYSDIPLKSDREGLLRDREFLNHLRMRASHLQTTNTETKELTLHARKLIEMIDNEIKLQ
ncbi:DUF6090 family protein [Eudoraea adriatica]|uniref:DUF6090 family protein n=1 Tax=Eudoraea adriatica TaxID=446681 RepID=UPI0012F9CFC1|nr:DUF6090 family protein [Eudoraea adriatica]